MRTLTWPSVAYWKEYGSLEQALRNELAQKGRVLKERAAPFIIQHSTDDHFDADRARRLVRCTWSSVWGLGTTASNFLWYGSGVPTPDHVDLTELSMVTVGGWRFGPKTLHAAQDVVPASETPSLSMLQTVIPVTHDLMDRALDELRMRTGR